MAALRILFPLQDSQTRIREYDSKIRTMDEGVEFNSTEKNISCAYLKLDDGKYSM